jgi:hypothetical protein
MGSNELDTVSYVVKEINCEQGCISSLKFSDRFRSYHRLRSNGRIIDFVGNGTNQINGHPTTNHSIFSQDMFFNSWGSQNSIAVLKELKNGMVELLGYYKINGFKKVLSNEGFAFFHFHLHAYKNCTNHI